MNFTYLSFEIPSAGERWLNERGFLAVPTESFVHDIDHVSMVKDVNTLSTEKFIFDGQRLPIDLVYRSDVPPKDNVEYGHPEK